ncbi:MAG: hypothetical protein BWX64_02443 [Acidobacteria bacterium ADurb.Bin051]|nr:MAG: hypothetical protein BWX64_02443 [Acidobacteria bacterium ADurb.Bin051]
MISRSPGWTPLRTSTRPSAVRSPRVRIRSRASPSSATKARKPRSLGRIEVWGITGAVAESPTGTTTSAKTPGRRPARAGSSIRAVISTIRELASAASATWMIVARYGVCASRTRKRAVIPECSAAASCSGTWKRSRSGSRRSSVASTAPAWTYWPVWALRVWITPETGARTSASRRFSSASASAARAWARSASAIATRVRQASTSSARTRSGLRWLTASRRARPALASASAASARSRVARAASTLSR